MTANHLPVPGDMAPKEDGLGTGQARELDNAPPLGLEGAFISEQPRASLALAGAYNLQVISLFFATLWPYAIYYKANLGSNPPLLRARKWAGRNR